MCRCRLRGASSFFMDSILSLTVVEPTSVLSQRSQASWTPRQYMENRSARHRCS
jgi:hypothetical protein